MSVAILRNWKPIGAAALAALAVGGLGAAVTTLSPWYYGLVKPSWQPPDWLFGTVWTTIFALAAIAGVLAWNAAPDGRFRALMLAGFAINGTLNVLWSVLFFDLHRPDWALMEVGFLFLSVLALIVLLGRVSVTAGALLVPYLAWVGFASFLNLTIVRLNDGFAGG